MARFDEQSFLRELERLSALSPEEQQAETVETVLRWAEPDQARALRLCAIPHEFDVQTLRALWPGQKYNYAEGLFEKLGKFAIVGERGEGKKAVVDWARASIFRQWLAFPKREEFAAASERLHIHFERLAQEAVLWPAGDEEGRGVRPASAFSLTVASMFHLLGARQDQGFAQFQQLVREKRRAFRLGDCEFLIRLVHEYDPVLTHYHLTYLKYSEGKLALDRRNLDLAGELFRKVLDTDAGPEMSVRALLRLGTIEAERRQWPNAIARYREARQLLFRAGAEIKDRTRLRHRALQALGVAHRESGDLFRAGKYLRSAAGLAHRESDTAGLAISRNSLGTLYRQLGEYRRAIKEYRGSLKVLDESKNKFQRAQVFNNIGMAYLDMRRWRPSVIYFRRSINIKLAVGDTVGIARSHNNLVRAYRNIYAVPVPENDIPELEMTVGSEGLSLAEFSSADEGIVLVRGTTLAIDAAQHSVKLFKELHDFYEAGVASRNLGRLYRSLGKKEQALLALSEAGELFKASDPTRMTPEAKAIALEIKMFKRGRRLPIWLWAVIILVVVIVFGIAVILWKEW